MKKLRHAEGESLVIGSPRVSGRYKTPAQMQLGSHLCKVSLNSSVELDILCDPAREAEQISSSSAREGTSSEKLHHED